MKVKRDLSTFVREKYQIAHCAAYLHVFAHTTMGKPLAVVFDANDDHISQMRYLDEALDPSIWHYRHRINKRCIQQIEQWPEYFVKKSEADDQPREGLLSESPLLQALAKRYRYDILYKTRLLFADQPPSRFIVIRFTDVMQSRSWDFELTAMSWHPLRNYAAHPADNLSLIASGEQMDDEVISSDQAIKRLTRALPLSWLTRPVQTPVSDVIGKSMTRGSNQHQHPCWDDQYERITIGKRPVTLDSFYHHYLHGLQLPSADERQSPWVKTALHRLYFDCLYDKNGHTDLTNNSNQLSSSSIDSVLYQIVPVLRICHDNQHFDPLRQRCQ